MDLLNLTYYGPAEYEYILLKVPSEFIARPDLISLDQYGTTEYVDVICKVNGISNPFELNEGMVLVIPEPSYVHLFDYNQDNIETLNINQQKATPIPKPKTKKEKRKPNEAVVNDRRYKLDTDRRIVVY